jgi:hypothetical protein
MERRTASHTEEEELNQRRRLLNLARKGDPKAITKLFELYQVRVYSGDLLGKSGRLPAWPSVHQKPRKTHQKAGKSRGRKRVAKRLVRRRSASLRRSTRVSRRVSARKARRRLRR